MRNHNQTLQNQYKQKKNKAEREAMEENPLQTDR